MTTTAERTRFTIAVDPDVYEAFAYLAHTSGVSLSRCIGDWLRDTAEAAQMTTLKVRDARRQPGEAFEAYMREVAESLPGIQAKMRETGWGTLAASGSASVVPHGWTKEENDAFQAKSARVFEREQVRKRGVPPSSNTGGKVPQENPKNTRGQK